MNAEYVITDIKLYNTQIYNERGLFHDLRGMIDDGIAASNALFALDKTLQHEPERTEAQAAKVNEEAKYLVTQLEPMPSAPNGTALHLQFFPAGTHGAGPGIVFSIRLRAREPKTIDEIKAVYRALRERVNSGVNGNEDGLDQLAPGDSHMGAYQTQTAYFAIEHRVRSDG